MKNLIAMDTVGYFGILQPFSWKWPFLIYNLLVLKIE